MIELLSPAKNIECGKAAIDNGADAVYIGGPRFGARAAAGNSISEISELVSYAHQFGAKVYVTLNTIIYDDEIDDVIEVIEQLNDAHVDALIVQDMAIAELAKDIPTPPLHASTQMDIRTPDKVRWLWQAGFRRVVLARELSLAEIEAIHKAVPEMELEVFVHGALCVSYSGQCYASQYCFSRSANRGECAQFCRLKFNLVNQDGQTIEKDKYLLSLKDMNRLERLSDLIQAGACSFKIEGRLKDADYVKNTTAAYSQALSSIVAKDSHLQRSSYGHCKYDFTPNLDKTFNRGYTTYLLDGRSDRIADFNTPKSKGEYVGDVKEIRRNSFTVAGLSAFANGDGLCFTDKGDILTGFRINRVEGNRLFPHKMPEGLYEGARLFRNYDIDFQRILSAADTKRKLNIKMIFKESANGFSLTMTDERGLTATETIIAPKEQARTPQEANIRTQLLKLGNTIYECTDFKMEMSDDWFIPSSLLADLRRRCCERLHNEECKVIRIERCHSHLDESHRVPEKLTYLANISNSIAREYHTKQGAKHIDPAFELQQPEKEKLIMQCKHCILFALGKCRKTTQRHQQQADLYSSLYLQLPDKRRFRLEFNCKECVMKIYAP